MKHIRFKPMIYRRPGRTGMTLLEVMLALSLMMGAVMALSRIAFLARRHAIASEDRTQSQLICQDIMQEIIAGIRPLQNVSTTTVEEYPQWQYAVEVQPLGDTPLIVVSVTVARLPEEDNGSGPEVPAAATSSTEPLRGYRLVRWVRSGGRGVSGAADDTLQEEGLSNSPWGEEAAPFGTTGSDLQLDNQGQ